MMHGLKNFCVKSLMTLGLITLMISLSGCLEMKDELKLNADGSGTWKMKVVMSPQMVQMAASGGGSSNIPQNKEEAMAKVKDVEGLKLKSYSVVDDPKTGKTITAEYSFTSIAALMNSDVAQGGLGWEFRQDDDEFVAVLDNDQGPQEEEINDQQFMMMKQMLNGFKMDRTLILPNAVTKVRDGEKVGPKTVQFMVAFDENTTKDDFVKTSKMQPEYRCSMKGITIELPLKPKADDQMAE